MHTFVPIRLLLTWDSNGIVCLFYSHFLANEILFKSLRDHFRVLYTISSEQILD